ncbi:MAG TPA: sulfotransferase [Steroidobacteraceae bacterium]|nr:sulfotransferase [Steroidobacteraceae bacterium]
MESPHAPRSVFDEAVGLIGAGRFGAAEARCRRALERWPGDVNLQGLLGALLLKCDRLAEAEALLRAVTEAEPDFAKPQEDLGFLLVTTGRPAEALPYLERATRLDPSLDRAWFTLGKALAQLGRGVEADAAFERSFECSPERGMLARGAEHQKEGRLEAAEKLYRRILHANPGNVDALRLLASIAAGAGHADDAEGMLQEAIRLAPDYLLALIDLAQLYKEQDRYPEAIECFDRILALDPANAQAQFLRAGTLARASFTHEAVGAYRRCLELRPRHAGALLGLGHALKAAGDHDGAVAAYDECRRLTPDSGEVWWSLANLKTYRFDDAEVATMEEHAAAESTKTSSRVNFLFALGKAHEDRGDPERAFDFYRRGNAMQRAEVSYDPVQTEVVNDRIVAAFDAELFEALRDAGDPDPSPIFILGLPRSGSTLLEQVLASHPDVEGTAELPYVGRLATGLGRRRGGVAYPEAMATLSREALAELGREYLALARTHRRTSAPRFVDKMPNNFPNAGLIALMLPNARIVDARRHPMDACFSCWRQLFAKGQNFTYDLTEIGEYWLQYQRMMDHWAAVMPGRVLTVQYEEVVSDFEAQVRRLLEFCGLPFDAACLRFHESERPVRTPSALQVRQPLYDRAVGHWRRYERHLGELASVLEPVRERYRRYEADARASADGGEARPGMAPGGT